MDMSEPASVAMAPGTAAVIRVLAGADDTFTIRELGRLAGVSHARAAQVVDALARHGVVDIVDRGRARLCSLNREHLAAPALVALVGLRRSLVELLQRQISSWRIRPLHASVFGSTARGDGGVDSDIDVLVVRPDDMEPGAAPWSVQLHATAEVARRATGNSLSWFEVSRVELAVAVASQEPILREWRADSIQLDGSRLAEILQEVA
jgi:predicted nucleotidyltransferase